MKTVYLSGPITDLRGLYFIEKNIQRARDAAALLWQTNSIAPLCPHLNTYLMDGLLTHEQFLRGDLALMAGCDAVGLLPGWELSKGAKIEAKAALERGQPLFLVNDGFVSPALLRWAEGEPYVVPVWLHQRILELSRIGEAA